MKLRLKGNSVRLRLSQSEVRALDRQGWWEDATVFGPTATHRLVYRVDVALDGRSQTSMSTVGTETITRISLLKEDIAAWAKGSEVGIYFEEAGLKVAVEKDFRCLDEERDEDESDNFENPNLGHSDQAPCRAD